MHVTAAVSVIYFLDIIQFLSDYDYIAGPVSCGPTAMKLFLTSFFTRVSPKGPVQGQGLQ